MEIPQNKDLDLASQTVLFLEGTAEKLSVDDPKAELLWQAANLLRQIHGLGDGSEPN